MAKKVAQAPLLNLILGWVGLWVVGSFVGFIVIVIFYMFFNPT